MQCNLMQTMMGVYTWRDVAEFVIWDRGSGCIYLETNDLHPNSIQKLIVSEYLEQNIIEYYYFFLCRMYYKFIIVHKKICIHKVV